MLSRNKRRHKDTYDKDISIIHTVVTTPANVHDVTTIDELRRPDDWEVFSEAGYLGMGKLSEEKIAEEKVLSSIRFNVEHTLHRIKVQFGYKKVGYREAC